MARSAGKSRPATSLRPGDFADTPIWRFVSNDEPDETWLIPVRGRRVKSLAGKIVGAELTLADGSRHWATFSNVEPDNPELTEHFLFVSVWIGRRWFHLARYFDVDVKRSGPRMLAAALNRPLGKVFPMRYDLRPYVRGEFPLLAGAVLASPRKRLTRAQVIALAVPKSET